MIARAHTFGDADQGATVDVANLGFVPHPKNAHPAAEVMELALTPITERALDRLALTIAQLPAANELVQSLLNQTLQIAGSQVE
jgi:hypothetical protein